MNPGIKASFGSSSASDQHSVYSFCDFVVAAVVTNPKLLNSSSPSMTLTDDIDGILSSSVFLYNSSCSLLGRNEYEECFFTHSTKHLRSCRMYGGSVWIWSKDD
eukprot:GDKJ01058311.1.p2 GENE.GDKJ01058311.1~~GDKJ01058311.1.p2  ORF type:complete len:104 (-),score=13.84 GDKJ01058311.1:365-676(-)